MVKSVGLAVGVLAGATLLGGMTTAVSGQDLPRTPWGDPDLQGIWTNTTTTPLERPEELAGRDELTDEERVARDEERARNADRPPPPGQTGAYNDFWFERGLQSNRTSLIVEPADGLIPAYTPPAAARAARIHELRYGPTRDWVDSFHLYDRCLTRAMPGLMMPGFYNHNYNIMQTPDYVVVYVEIDPRRAPSFRSMGGTRSRLRSGSGWGAHAAAGKGTRWWSRPPT